MGLQKKHLIEARSRDLGSTQNIGGARMSGNTQIGARSTIGAQFHAYDALPTELRRVCSAVLVDYDAVGIRRQLRTICPSLLAREIEEAERATVSIFAYAYYGPDHPAAAPFVPRDVLKKFGLANLGKASLR
jgi:hypothetical protein